MDWTSPVAAAMWAGAALREAAMGGGVGVPEGGWEVPAGLSCRFCIACRRKSCRFGLSMPLTDNRAPCSCSACGSGAAV